MRLHTAGESHGPAVVAIVEGLPAGVPLDRGLLDRDLARRQRGHGRGGRQRIEHDEVEVLAGLRGGRTIGSPLVLVVRNRDHANWQDRMHPWDPPAGEERLTRPRPGHADLAGAIKLGTRDLRDVMERASARSTAARVAAGAVARQLLGHFGARVAGHAVQIGHVRAAPAPAGAEHVALAAENEVRCADPAAVEPMKNAIDAARKAGDSLGGVIEVLGEGVPPGLGSYAEWDERLDGRIAQALMSIPSVKGVEIGLGFAAAERPGSQVHDPILWDGAWFARPTNRAGGVEGGVSNGEPIVARAALKPIPTLVRPLPSVDLATRRPFEASHERSDCCVVPAAAVIAECAVAFVLADALLDKIGGDSFDETRRNFDGYVEQLRRF